MDMIGALEAIATNDGSADHKLIDSMRAVMRTYGKHNPHLFLFLTDDARSSIIDPELRAEIVRSGRRYEDLVEAIIREGVANGIFRTPLPPKVFAKTIAGMLNWTARWYVPGGALGRRTLRMGSPTQSWTVSSSLVNHEAGCDRSMSKMAIVTGAARGIGAGCRGGLPRMVVRSRCRSSSALLYVRVDGTPGT